MDRITATADAGELTVVRAYEELYYCFCCSWRSVVGYSTPWRLAVTVA